MSLLLEALKKAERAKEEAQKRAREGEGEATEELRLADEPAPSEEKRVMTRDELPPITSPLEIQSEDLATPAPAGTRQLALEGGPGPAGATRPGAEPQAAQRAAARRPFEAKMREPNPRLPFYVAVGALGLFALGTVIYFWMQLRPSGSIYNSNPQPPANEITAQPAQPAAAPQAGGPLAASGGTEAIPGLPGRESAPKIAPTRPARVAAAPPKAAPRVRHVARAPRAATHRGMRITPPARVARRRQPPRIHPLVAAGYAAYEAGDMGRARADYEQALREEPGNRDALLGLAAVDTRTGRVAQAESLYRRLLADNPRDPHAQAALLGLRAAQTNPVAAESRLKGLIADDAAESVLYFSLGNQYAQQQRWPDARQAYAKAAAMDPENADYAYNLAVSLEHVRQPFAALRHYRRALELGLKRTSSFDPVAAQARVQALER